MPVPNHSALAGHPTDGELVWPQSHQKPPHYMIRAPVGTKTYTVAVNVLRKDGVAAPMGIHNYGDETGNRGTRIPGEVLDGLIGRREAGG
jgi:hypothetical protein